MNWVIITIVCLSMLGSLLWLMPSPRQRAQAILRQHAMRSGLQVQMTKLLFPRAIGEHAGDERQCIAYRLGRTKTPISKTFCSWQVFRLVSHATTGLPEGWCWGRGEGALSDAQCALITEVLASLPADVYAVESTPVAVSVYWEERGSQQTVDQLLEALRGLTNEGV